MLVQGEECKELLFDIYFYDHSYTHKYYFFQWDLFSNRKDYGFFCQKVIESLHDFDENYLPEEAYQKYNFELEDYKMEDVCLVLFVEEVRKYVVDFVVFGFTS